MSIKDLKQTIENAVLEFSRENEIKSMDIHITTTEKVKCDMMGSIKESRLETETEIKIK